MMIGQFGPGLVPKQLETGDLADTGGLLASVWIGLGLEMIGLPRFGWELCFD